jgi:hypothetical protein
MKDGLAAFLVYCMACICAALITSDYIRLMAEQIDDLTLAFITPLSTDDNCRWHQILGSNWFILP